MIPRHRRHPSINGENGYALIAVVFLVAAMIATAMICVYPLAYERKSEARNVITTERDLKVKRALLGRLADHAAGEYGNCGGIFSDMGPSQATMAGARHLRMAFTKRGVLVGASGSGGDWYEASYAEPFLYNESLGYWAGYRGKRYYNAVPADRSVDPEYRDGNGNTYSIKTYCPKATPYYSFKSTTNNFMVIGHRLVYRIKLRDYTCTPGDRIEMELVMTKGQTVISQLAEDEDSEENGRPYASETHADHILHTFHFEFSQNSSRGRQTHMAGLVKAVIRVDGNTVYSTSLVCPFYARLLGGYYTIQDLFVTEIAYSG
jgi:hypothetical protein